MDFMNNEDNQLKQVKKKKGIVNLKKWDNITVNKDTDGKKLMKGTQSMVALALGIVGEHTIDSPMVSWEDPFMPYDVDNIGITALQVNIH